MNFTGRESNRGWNNNPNFNKEENLLQNSEEEMLLRVEDYRAEVKGIQLISTKA